MIEINTFDARASVSSLLQANRSGATNTSPSSQAKAEKSVSPPATQSFRLASRTETSLFAVDLTAIGDGRKDVAGALSGSLEELLEIFHGRGKAGEALETALSSVSDLVDAAAGDSDVVGIQIRLASVVRSFGAENGDEASYGSVTGFAIEVGLIRAGRVSAEDVELVGLAGEHLELNVEQRRTGVVDGVYRIQDKAPFGEALAKVRGENKAQVEALQNALDRLRLVQDALSDYRNGDTRALEGVEKLFRSGTLDAGAVRAISDVRGPGQTVVPGSGVISFS
jgi:hypothetical protein